MASLWLKISGIYPLVIAGKASAHTKKGYTK